MKHVKHVVANVKGPIDLDLGERTLVVGPNRAGKSAILDALVLPLTGAPYSEGIGRKPNEILALKPSGDRALESTITFSDDTTAAWSCEGSTARSSKPVWTGASGALVLREASALLQGDTKRVRAALLERLGAKVSREVLAGAVPRSLWPVWLLAAGKTDAHEVWSADDLSNALGGLDTALRAARKELKAMQDVADKSPLPLPQELADELEALTNAAAQEGLPAAQIELMREQKLKLEEQLAWAEQKLALTVKPEGAPPYGVEHALARVRDVQQWLLVEMRARDMNVRCPCCGEPDIDQQRVQVRAAELAQTIETIEDARRAVRAYDDAVVEVERLTREIAVLGKRLASATLEVTVDRARLSELQKQAMEYESYTRALELRSGQEQRVQALKSLKDIGARLIATTLDSKVELLEAAIQSRLPAGMKAGIVLRDGAREVCRITLDGQDIRALSGAERAVITSAFAAALVDLAGGRDDAALLLIDDVWFDSKVLPEFLASIGREPPAQVVVCAVEYAGAVPEGWVVVRLG